MSRTRTTWWNLTFEFAAIGITLISGILLVPLYLRQIPPEIYGYWLATGNVLAWLSIADPGFSSLIQQRVAVSYGAGNHDRVGQYLAAAVLFAIVLAILIAITGIVTGFSLHVLLGVGEVEGWDKLMVAFAWAVAGTALSVASYSVAAGAIGLQGSLGPGLFYTAAQLTALGLAVWWLTHGWGVEALGMANFVRGFGLLAGNGIYLWWRIRREKIICRVSKQVFRELIGLTSFTFLSKVPGVFSGQMDAFIAARLIGPEAAIVMNLTRKGFDVARMLAERPTNAIRPAISHLAGEGDISRLKVTVKRLLRMILWTVGLLVAGFLALNDDFVRLWVGQKFFAGSLINGIFAASVGLSILVGTSGNLGFALGDVRGNSIASLAMSSLNLGLLWIGARFGGLLGLAAAPLVGMLVVGIPYFPLVLARQLSMQATDWKELRSEVVGVVCSTGACAVIIGSFHPDGWAAFTGMAVLCVAFYLLITAIFSRTARMEVLAFLQAVVRFGAKTF